MEVKFSKNIETDLSFSYNSSINWSAKKNKKHNNRYKSSNEFDDTEFLVTCSNVFDLSSDSFDLSQTESIKSFKIQNVDENQRKNPINSSKENHLQKFVNNFTFKIKLILAQP